ncbi:MAG: 30S ribosomal protein S18 [Anaerolineae bacterium]
MADYRDRDFDESSSEGEGRRSFRPRRDYQRRPRVCPFCSEKLPPLDYKDVPTLRRFVSERGRILPRRRTAACAKHQRMISTAIKRARQIALLPYTAEHTRAR